MCTRPDGYNWIVISADFADQAGDRWIACRPGKFHLTSGSFEGAVRRFSLREQLAKNIEA